MTVQNPAIFLQEGSHPAEDVRRALGSIVGQAGGLVSGSDLTVSENSAGTDMSVDIAGGSIWIAGTEGAYQGVYYCENRGVQNVPVQPADVVDNRIDLVVARVHDSSYSGTQDEWELDIITGVPDASPVAPALPANSFSLATIDVVANATIIENDDIIDTRVLTDETITGNLIVEGDLTVNTQVRVNGTPSSGNEVMKLYRAQDGGWGGAGKGGYTGYYDSTDDRLGYIGYVGNDDLHVINEDADGKLKLGTNATDRLVIDSAGDVTIGGDLTYANQGLVLVTPSSVTGGTLDGATVNIGSGVSSVTVTDAFSSAFDNYVITINGMTQSVNQTAITLNLGGATGNHHTVGWYMGIATGSLTGTRSYNQNYLVIADSSASGTLQSYSCELLYPYGTERTHMKSNNISSTWAGNYVGLHDSLSSHTQFAIAASSGTITGGTIRVYGYNG